MLLESLPFYISDSKFYSTLSSRMTTPIESQLATSYIHMPKISWKCPLRFQERLENRCIANIYIICLDFYTRWTTTMTSSFMLQHSLAKRSCDFMNLPVLWSVSSVSSVVISLMWATIRKWYVLVWIVIIKINNGLIIFSSTHGNKPPPFTLVHSICWFLKMEKWN